MAEPDVNHTTRISTPNAGNGLAAFKLIPAGTPIIKISSPHLILLEKAHLESTCSWCFSQPTSSTLKRCTSCKFTYYCTTDCQKKDWNAIHKKECKILKSMPNVPPTPTRALTQLILRHKYEDDLYPRWEGLVINMVSIMKDSDRFDQLSLQALAAAKFTGQTEWVELGVKLLCQMATNAFRVTLPDDTPIGLCFEPTLALANHSCSPNAVVVFDGRAVSFRALTDIEQGEEVFISYIDPTQTLEKRRQELGYGYFFTCKCEKCSKDEIAYQNFLRLQPDIFSISTRFLGLLASPTDLATQANNCVAEYQKLLNHPKLGRTFKSNNTQQKLDLILKSTKNTNPKFRLSQLKNLYNTNKTNLPALSPYPIILQNIYLIYLQTQSWIPALICLLSLALHTDPFMYPTSHHPVRVIRLFTIARLFKHISTFTPPEMAEQLESLDTDLSLKFRDILPMVRFEDVLQAVMAIVKEEVGWSHGVGSRFAREVEEEVRELEDGRTREGVDPGAALGRWIVDGKDEEGLEAIEGVKKVLWKLAGSVGSLLNMAD